MEVAVVIPTRNRPWHVMELVTALTAQELLPCAVVVVDSSPEHARMRSTEVRCEAFDVRIETVSTASLPFQRNVGARAALEADVDAVCFLDDDVRPKPDYLKRLAEVLMRDTVGVVAGVSGTSGWSPTVKPFHTRLYDRVFCLSGPADGRVLKSGINMPVDADLPGLHRAEWLFGCSMWRAEILKKRAFHDGLPGQALCEDVEFSVRAGKDSLLVVDTAARLDHLLEVTGRPSLGLHYQRFVRNRAEVVKAMGSGWIGRCAFWLSVVGTAVRLARHCHSSADYRERLVGLLRGVLATIARRDAR